MAGTDYSASNQATPSGFWERPGFGGVLGAEMTTSRRVAAVLTAATLFTTALFIVGAPGAKAADSDCPLNQGQVINKTFNHWPLTAIVSDKNQGNATIGPVDVNIPAGRYSIKLASYDNHSVPAVPPQKKETWFVFGWNDGKVVFASKPIADLPENQSQLVQTVDLVVNIPALDQLTVRHGAWPDETTANSVHPLCVAFEPAPTPPTGLVDPATGLWRLRQGFTQKQFFFGNPGDVPFMGDWDCDGVATPGLYRRSDGFVYLRNSNSQGNADIQFFFGVAGDLPLAGDFNNSGCDTVSIYRPNEARFYIVNKLGKNNGGLGPADFSFLFGNKGDKPVVGDWDADGIDEIGLHRESTGFFYYRNTLNTGIASDQFFFGNPGDRFIAGDWGNMDGKDTPAVFRPANTTFYFRFSNTQGNADDQLTWGQSAWRPVAGEFTLP